MEKFWRKNITFVWQKVDIYFEMVQFGPMVLEKKGLATINAWVMVKEVLVSVIRTCTFLV